MATNDGPRIDSGFLDLVEKMRREERDYFENKNARALDRVKKLARLIDAYIETYRREAAKWEAWQKAIKDNGGDNGAHNMPLL